LYIWDGEIRKIIQNVYTPTYSHELINTVLTNEIDMTSGGRYCINYIIDSCIHFHRTFPSGTDSNIINNYIAKINTINKHQGADLVDIIYSFLLNNSFTLSNINISTYFTKCLFLYLNNLLLKEKFIEIISKLESAGYKINLQSTHIEEIYRLALSKQHIDKIDELIDICKELNLEYQHRIYYCDQTMYKLLVDKKDNSLLFNFIMTYSMRKLTQQTYLKNILTVYSRHINSKYLPERLSTLVSNYGKYSTFKLMNKLNLKFHKNQQIFRRNDYRTDRILQEIFGLNHKIKYIDLLDEDDDECTPNIYDGKQLEDYNKEDSILDLIEID